MAVMLVQRLGVDHSVLYDAEYRTVITQYTWRLTKGGYVLGRRRGAKSDVYMHRVVMGCTKGDGLHVHHQNFVTTDNRRINLSRLTPEENLRIKRPRGKKKNQRKVEA